MHVEAHSFDEPGPSDDAYGSACIHTQPVVADFDGDLATNVSILRPELLSATPAVVILEDLEHPDADKVRARLHGTLVCV